MKRPEVELGQPWRFPGFESATLSNGLTVWHIHLPGQPLTTFRLVIPAPLAQEERTLEGVGSVALHSIDEGTLAHPDGRIGELLERHGATLHGTVRHRYSTFGGQAPARRLPEVLPLFVEILTQPQYSETDVALHIESATAQHLSRVSSPDHAARLALSSALFGEHRSARPASGTPETLANITADAVRQWHQQHLVADQSVLIVAGSERLADIVGYFEQWHTAPRQPVSFTPAPVLPAQSVVVDRPEAVQTSLVLASRTVTRTDQRWPALRVAAHALAGAFASRLNLELRERCGYTYGIGGGVVPGIDEGQFSISGSVRTEVTTDSLARILDGIALKEPFSEEEIVDARNYLVGIAPLANETSYDVVGQATALAAAGLTPDFLNQHFAQLSTVTAEEATHVLRELVTPDDVTIAVSGVGAELTAALASLGRTGQQVEL